MRRAHGPIVSTPRSRKNLISHVSTTVRCAGRIENQGIVSWDGLGSAQYELKPTVSIRNHKDESQMLQYSHDQFSR